MSLRLLLLTLKAILELAVFECWNACFGFGPVAGWLVGRCPTSNRNGRVSQETICRAVNLAACFYFKPVLCWQRSVVTARLMRKHGIACRLVIGYDPSPFLSHAWVETDTCRIVNDLPTYPERLRVLRKL
jgi:hypothetical protein